MKVITKEKKSREGLTCVGTCLQFPNKKLMFAKYFNESKTEEEQRQIVKLILDSKIQRSYPDLRVAFVRERITKVNVLQMKMLPVQLCSLFDITFEELPSTTAQGILLDTQGFLISQECFELSKETTLMKLKNL